MSLTNRKAAPFLGLLAILGLAADPSVHAQSALRPGSSTRPTGSATGRTTGFGGTGTSSTSSSNTGPRQYRSNTLLGDAIIQIDPETRSLIIVTDDQTHAELEKVIKELDRPKPQVLIKVVFLEVTWDKGSDIGVEGSYTFNLKNDTLSTSPTTGNTVATTTKTIGSTTDGTNSVTTLTTPLNQVPRTLNMSNLYGLSQLTTGSFVRLSSDNWNATLHALATHGKTEVLSRPTIMARNNQQAVIVVGQEVPFVTNSRVTDAGQTINTVQYDNVGIILSVTPFITSHNMVEMIVAPEISALTSQTVAISNTASSPVISKRSAETVVVTPDGTTSVIGGLMQTQKTTTVQKIPYLGDIPLLGLPFKHTVKDETKTELLIFLTPYIVHDQEDLEGATTDEASRSELIHKAFTEKDLEKFFQTTNLPMPDTVKNKTTIVNAYPTDAKDTTHPQTKLVKPAPAPTPTPTPTPTPAPKKKWFWNKD